jgi:hypothetical protein
MIGYDNVPLNMLMIPLPLTYNLIYLDGPNTIMDSVLVNIGLFDNSLAPVISLNPLHDQIDSLKINATITSNFNVDAWGNVTIPLGSYDALRLKVEEATTTQFSVYCSAGGLAGGWFSAETFFPIETEIANRYQWWSNDPLVKFMIAELEMDSLSNNVEFVTFLTTPQANSASNLESVKVNVYPNPTSKDLMIITDLINCSYSLTDVKGSKLLRNEFNNSTIIDLSSYSSGTYLLQIYTEEGNVTTKRVVVE